MSIFRRGDKNKPASEVFAKVVSDKERKQKKERERALALQEIARDQDIKAIKKALVKTAKHLGDIAEKVANYSLAAASAGIIKRKDIPKGYRVTGNAEIEVGGPFNSVPATEVINLAETRQLFEAAEAGKVGIRIDFSHSSTPLQSRVLINFDLAHGSDFQAQTYQQALMAVAQRVWRQDHPHDPVSYQTTMKVKGFDAVEVYTDAAKQARAKEKPLYDNLEATAKKLGDKGGFNNWQEAHFMLDKEMQRFIRENGLQQSKTKGRAPSAGPGKG